MSQSYDQAYIDAVITYANRKRCSAEYRNLLDLWAKTDPIKNPDLAEFSYEQIREMHKRIKELYRQRK